MNIKEFKEGDIITREESANGDRSYMANEMELVGVKNGIIILIKQEYGDEYNLLKLRTDWWSEGWNHYPTGLIKKAKKRIKELLKSNI